MAERGDLVYLLTNATLNAVFGWILTGFVVLVGFESVLDADWVWVVFSAVVAILVLIPPISYRDVRVMLPWEVVVLVVLPLLGRGILGAGLAGEFASYLSVAALALAVAVELDVFTSVKMTTWFAVFFVVIVTMATAGAWAVVEWLSDVYLGTNFIYPVPPPVSTELEQQALESLMWDFVAATGTGVLAGMIFALYFRQHTQARIRLPAWVRRSME